MHSPESLDMNRFLVVDDEPSVREALRSVLKYFFPDFTCDLAENGNEALESFQNHHQSVVFMDLQMPVMDGIESFMELQNRRTRVHQRWQLLSRNQFDHIY